MNTIKRMTAALWQACEDHQWLPLAVALFGLVLVNMVQG